MLNSNHMFNSSKQKTLGQIHASACQEETVLYSTHLLLLPLIVSSRQWWAEWRLPANFVLLFHHAVREGNKVALQDDQALPQTLGRQSAFGHLARELLLIFN